MSAAPEIAEPSVVDPSPTGRPVKPRARGWIHLWSSVAAVERCQHSDHLVGHSRNRGH